MWAGAAVGEAVRWEKILAAGPDDLCLVPGTLVMEGES